MKFATGPENFKGVFARKCAASDDFSFASYERGWESGPKKFFAFTFGGGFTLISISELRKYTRRLAVSSLLIKYIFLFSVYWAVKRLLNETQWVMHVE